MVRYRMLNSLIVQIKLLKILPGHMIKDHLKLHTAKCWVSLEQGLPLEEDHLCAGVESFDVPGRLQDLQLLVHIRGCLGLQRELF